MKRFTIKACAAALLIAVMLTASACGNKDEKDKGSNSSAAVTSDTQNAENSDEDENSGETENFKAEASSKEDPTDAKEKGDLPALPDDDGKDVGYKSEGLLIYNNAAYEMFYGWDDIAKEYAATMSRIKEHLGSDIKVYNVLVPTHCGVTLPERFFDEYGLPNQKDYLNTIINSYSADIKGINTYDTLAHHRDEYLYFNSDHHWTGLGAYYAYKDFCKAAGIDYLRLNELEEGVIEGYHGSLTNSIDESLVKTDSVHYFTKDVDTETTKFDENGQNEEQTRLFHTYAEGYNAYGVFLGGDSPLMVCKNKDGNGKKIAVVKESYGNAFCPLIAMTYGETHMIDFRYINFDFKQYLKDNDIDEVIFINNAMATATPARCEELAALAE